MNKELVAARMGTVVDFVSPACRNGIDRQLLGKDRSAYYYMLPAIRVVIKTQDEIIVR